MRLHVNLIPALAYALVMMFSHMTGMAGANVQPAPKQQVGFVPTANTELNKQENCVYVAANGQVVLSNGTGKGNLEWKIPYLPETKITAVSL